jgi:hypothetical protein
MSHSARVLRRPRRRQPSQARTATILAVGGLALLAAACGGSLSSGGSPSAGGTANARSAGARSLGYSRCMRSRGVPEYPDATGSDALPDGLPKVSPQELGVSNAQYQAAQQACAHLLPNGGRLTQTASQQDLRAMLGFARCMRSHGVPGWPDPTNGSAGWGFNLVHVQGFNPNSSQINQQMSECARRLPAGIGVPLSRPGRPG